MNALKRNKYGRPTLFTVEMAAAICERLANGESLRTVCQDNHMPDERTVRTWALENYKGFSPQYARAREIGFHRMAEEILRIADEATLQEVNKARLQIDTRKWLMSKMLPKTYGKHPTEKDCKPNSFADEILESIV